MFLSYFKVEYEAAVTKAMFVSMWSIRNESVAEVEKLSKVSSWCRVRRRSSECKGRASISLPTAEEFADVREDC